MSSCTWSLRAGKPRLTGARGDNPAIAFIAVLGSEPASQVTINEMTTIASVWTNAQFLEARRQGPCARPAIAAGNVHNFVDLGTGGHGATIADGLNSTQTPTLANFATLANVLAGCATRVKPDACNRLFAAATAPDGKAPTDTLMAAEFIARAPWQQPGKGLRPAGEFLSRSGGQDGAAADAFHALPEFCPKRLGFAAQVCRRRFERWRQS